MVILTISSFIGSQPKITVIPISQILTDAKNDKIGKISVSENDLTVKYKDGQTVESERSESGFIRVLFSKTDGLGLEPGKIALVNENDITKNFWVNTFLNFGPIALFFVLIFTLYKRQMQGTNSLFLLANPLPKPTLKICQK